MYSSSSDDSDGSNDLLAEIIETLEASGVRDDAYQLHDHVDVEALSRLLASSDGDTTVQFTVEGVRLGVSSGSVDVLGEDRADSVGE